MIVVIMKRLQEFPPEVQTEFGQILEFGHGCCVNQGANAVKAYEAAAEQGYTLAEYYLGYMYRKRNVVEKNDAKALVWFTRAAKKGHIYAIDTLKKMMLEH